MSLVNTPCKIKVLYSYQQHQLLLQYSSIRDHPTFRYGGNGITIYPKYLSGSGMISFLFTILTSDHDWRGSLRPGYEPKSFLKRFIDSEFYQNIWILFTGVTNVLSIFFNVKSCRNMVLSLRYIKNLCSIQTSKGVIVGKGKFSFVNLVIDVSNVWAQKIWISLNIMWSLRKLNFKALSSSKLSKIREIVPHKNILFFHVSY